MARAATSGGVKDLRRQAQELKAKILKEALDHATDAKNGYGCRRCRPRTVINQLSAWMIHYNGVHPHKALGYRSPREFIAAHVDPGYHAQLFGGNNIDNHPAAKNVTILLTTKTSMPDGNTPFVFATLS
jgi:hypothetical protein